MALSNILREPRREITESLAGIAIFTLPLFADWKFACWFQGTVMPKDVAFRIIGLLFGFIILMLTAGFIALTHAMGEAVCELLARHGLELRPKVRH